MKNTEPDCETNKDDGEETACSAPRPRILVVEDEYDIRSLLCHSLRAQDFSVSEAEDGHQAMLRCREELPDLIITDIMMPRMDGREFLSWFRTTYPRPFVPVLILTALADVEQKVKGLELGADDYLTKPFNFLELQARVRALLRIRDLTKMLARQSSELQAANEKLSEMQETLIRKERELVAVQLAGAAAHHLGQPITAILLHCRLLQKELQTEISNSDAKTAAIQAIENECEFLKGILDRMKAADPSAVETYVGEETILAFPKDEH